MRCFLSIDIGGAAAEKLAELAKTARAFGIEGKFVGPENFHINLRFFEDANPAEVASKLKGLGGGRFAFDIDGLGEFNGKVLFAKVAPNEKLALLAKEVEGRLGGGDKPFVAHVTLCRLRGHGNVKGFIRESGIVIKGLEADRLRLKKSVLTPRGPVYSTVEEIPL